MSSMPSSSHKFFRRTSKSPLHASRVALLTETNYNVCMKSRVSDPSQTDRDISISISNISDENSSRPKLNKIGGDFKKYRETQKTIKNTGEPSITTGRNSQDIKFTYIPMESMATLHTLSATQKIITQSLEFSKSVTITKEEEYQSLKKQVELLSEENKYLLQRERVKNNENMKLSKQIQIAKKNNHNLQNDVKKLKQAVSESERNLKISQINHENLKKSLEASDFMKNKYEQNYKELNKTVLCLQSELRSCREQSNGMARLVLMKDSQIKQIQSELNKQLKRFKTFVEVSTSSQTLSPKALRAKSITFQQNKPPQPKQPTIKPKDPSSKAYTERYSRSVQTEANNLQKSLKQIEHLTGSLAEKSIAIKNMENQLLKLTNRTKQFDEVLARLNESQTLIGLLNDKIVHESVLKLAAKYKYI